MEYEKLIAEADEFSERAKGNHEPYVADLVGRLGDALRECIFGAPVDEDEGALVGAEEDLPPFPE